MDYAGDTFQRSSSGLIIPDALRSQADHAADITTCPAASIVHVDDRPAVHCSVTDSPLLIEADPIATGGWCCGEPGMYADPAHGCPVWRARDDKQRLKAMKDASDQRNRDRLTRQQIERGTRVDDRPERAMEKAASAIFADYTGEE
jgi:hypothetical protein